MPKAPKRTIQQRKTSEAILRLEFKQSKELSDVMREASQEASDRLAKMPANAAKSKRLKAVRSLFDDIEKTANKRMKAKGKLAESLTKGLEDSQKLTQEAAKIPNASVFNDFAPVLPVNALALVSSEFVERVESITDELKTRALRQTKLAMANGEGIEDIKRRLIGSGLRGDRGRDGVFRRARWRAEMLGRNTVNDLSNRGRMLGFQQLDKEFPELALRVRWSAATDSRTSDICEALNGQIRKLGENFSGGGVTVAQPPAHVNCRSAVVPVPEEYTPEFEESWEKAPETPQRPKVTRPKAKKKAKKPKTNKQLVKTQTHESVHDFFNESFSDVVLSKADDKALLKQADYEPIPDYVQSKVKRLKKIGLNPGEARGVAEYIGDDYTLMNSNLWNAGAWEGPEADKYLARNRLAASGMKKLPKTTLDAMQEVDPDAFEMFMKEGQVLRHDMKNVPEPAVQGLREKYSKLIEDGDNAIADKFLSTTFNTSGEKYFSEGANVRFNVKGKLDGTGRSSLVDVYKNSANEREVLFQPATEFKVIKVREELSVKYKRFVEYEGYTEESDFLQNVGAIIGDKPPSEKIASIVEGTLKSKGVDQSKIDDILEGLKINPQETIEKHTQKQLIKEYSDTSYDNPYGYPSNSVHPQLEAFKKAEKDLGEIASYSGMEPEELYEVYMEDTVVEFPENSVLFKKLKGGEIPDYKAFKKAVKQAEVDFSDPFKGLDLEPLDDLERVTEKILVIDMEEI